MEELDNAYEAVEMLRELGLPVSKAQLDNIEKLEKESGNRQREDLKYYFLNQCYTSYTKRIMYMKQAKVRGEVIVAKPVLLLTIIEGIETELFNKNEFQLTDWLEKQYVELMQLYMRKSQFDKPTDISNPFWHLQSDGFWHLKYQGEQLGKSITPSKSWLKEKVEHAWLDDDLWILLLNKEWRQKLRDFIIENKLTNP